MRNQLEIENAWSKGQLQERENQLACMANFSFDEIQYRMPSKSYALYIKEKWLQFQIKTLAQRSIIPFYDYKQFIDLCDQSKLEDRAKMSVSYFHNMALIDMNVWDLNANLGCLQLMALASWMNHEEERVAEMKRILAREQEKNLMIRFEQSNLMGLINTHNLIANDHQPEPWYLATQEQEISHFEDTFKLLGDDSIHSYLRRWTTFP